jgi:hypothetical protein
MDDITSILHPTDVAPYIQTFQQGGAAIGTTPNLKKTTLLSTLDPSFPNTHPSLCNICKGHKGFYRTRTIVNSMGVGLLHFTRFYKD